MGWPELARRMTSARAASTRARAPAASTTGSPARATRTRSSMPSHCSPISIVMTRRLSRLDVRAALLDETLGLEKVVRHIPGFQLFPVDLVVHLCHGGFVEQGADAV